MDKNQVIKNLDQDKCFLSLSPDESLCLTNKSLYSESGSYISRAKAQRVDSDFNQDIEPSFELSLRVPVEYSQSKSIKLLNGPEFKKRCSDDFDLVRCKLEVAQSSASCLRNEVASLQESIKNSNKAEKIISLVETKLTEFSFKIKKFENILLQLPSEIETIIKQRINDANGRAGRNVENQNKSNPCIILSSNDSEWNFGSRIN
ncbi:hypothetical protein BpHYR1_007216 [Brachionus plicatilis]|uniref:Uncharacterized protein n=1 Tax=Brachionus plicatilis TaxID=10195 RepID=A0A3M7PDI3_BRAPC|nr:hypothetical protein BpHYR1_007216 [Brachionus plicatilis]